MGYNTLLQLQVSGPDGCIFTTSEEYVSQTVLNGLLEPKIILCTKFPPTFYLYRDGEDHSDTWWEIWKNGRRIDLGKRLVMAGCIIGELKKDYQEIYQTLVKK